MPPRTVALIGAVCLTTGWLLASMLTPPVAKLQSLPERRAAAPASAAADDLPAFSERLHFEMRQAPGAPVTRRNPFAFGGDDRARRARKSEAPTEAAPPVTAAATVPPGPIFSLAGIAITETPEGSVLTAVVSDSVTIHLVKKGESVNGHTVVDVTEASVTLADAAGGLTVLRLR